MNRTRCHTCNAPTEGGRSAGAFYPRVCQDCLDLEDASELLRGEERARTLALARRGYNDGVPRPGLNGDAEAIEEHHRQPPAGRPANNAGGGATTDLGDGLGLPLVSIGPSGIGGPFQTEVRA